MGRDAGLVRKKTRALGISSLAVARRLRAEGKKRCPSCRAVFPLTEYVGRYCLTCHKERQMAARYGSLRGYVVPLLASIRSRCKHKGLLLNLDVETVLAMHERQDGKCFYSGLTMTWERRTQGAINPTNLSIDRKDPALGYTPDNVVLCCALVNTMKAECTPEMFVWWCATVVQHMEGKQ